MNMDSSCVRSNMQQKFMRDQSARMCAKCLGDRQLGPYGSEFELFLYLFVYPPLIAFGLIGNCINLLVLLSPQMRSRANNLLSALAFNDIIFFLLNIPHSAINFPPLRHDHWSRSIYFQIQNISWGFICWASATATWLVVAVCVERFLGIRYPLRMRASSHSTRRSVMIIVAITALTGLLTLYHHFELACRTAYFCNGVQNRRFCLPITYEKHWFSKNGTNPYSRLSQGLVVVSAYFTTFITILLPIFALVFFNGALIYELRKRLRQDNMLLEGKEVTPSKKDSTGNQLNVQQRQERKVTITIALIVGAFTLTQGPGLFNPIWSHIEKLFGSDYYNVYVAANCLQFIGKSLNFVLFCLTSENFRSRLGSVFKGICKGRKTNVTRYVMRKLTPQTDHSSL